MQPKPTKAKLVFVQSDGIKKTKDIEFDNTGKFTLNYPDLIKGEGLNSYYITTELQKEDGTTEKCEDIRRALMYDTSFAGTEKPYVKGEKEKVYGGSTAVQTTEETNTGYIYEKCTLSAGITCLDFRYTGTTIEMTIQNAAGFDMSNIKIAVDGAGCNAAAAGSATLTNGQTETYSAECTPTSGEFNGNINLTFTNQQTDIENSKPGEITLNIP
jgi:hypothetical protein